MMRPRKRQPLLDEYTSTFLYQGHRLDIQTVRNQQRFREIAQSLTSQDRVTNPHRELGADEVEVLEWAFKELAQETPE